MAHWSSFGLSFKTIDVAFDTSTLLRNLAKDADYMAAVAELSRPSGQ
ncbi:MAG: hypothetical protein AAFO63_09895 [Pseudomonadota bacterium]